jgi:phosphate transport system substrate-binding protein
MASVIGFAGLPVQALTISGSDLFGGQLEKTLSAELAAAGLDVSIEFDGSLLGLRDLEAGTVDASLLAIPDASVGESPLRKFPIGYQIVAFAVHSSNPVTQVTYQQLSDLFKEGGALSKWSDLTSDPAWTDRNISLLASRRGNAITLELFNAMVMKGASYKVDLRFLTGDNQSLINAVIEDPSAIVLTPAVQVQGSVKFLAVRGNEGGQAYTPSRDNVFFGDYPLRLPFYLVVADSMDEATLGTLLNVLYSDAITAALAKVDCLPVPEPEQRALLAPFE